MPSSRARRGRLAPSARSRGYSTRCALARQLHPGQRNNLDALCKRYGVDNSNRELHGALLDARLLADVYLAMTGRTGRARARSGQLRRRLAPRRAPLSAPPLRTVVPLVIIPASADELAAHEALLAIIVKASGRCVWRSMDGAHESNDAKASVMG